MMKRRISAFLLAAVLAFSCTAPAAYASTAKQAESTQEDAKDQTSLKITTKTYQEKFKTEDGQIYKEISYEYPVTGGNSDAAKRFNQFYKNQRTRWTKAAKKDLKDLQKAAAGRDDDTHFTDQVTCEITNCDDKYICVLQSGYVYTMGAHGTPYRISYIFDASTGKEISVSSILGMPKEQMNKKVRRLYLKKFDQTQKNGENLFYQSRKNVKDTLDKIDFNQNLSYLKNGRIWFYVEPYAVGPYAAGYIEVTIKL